MFEGLVVLPWWGYVLVALVLTHITIAAVTIFLHRHQAHRALDLHPVVSHFFRFWLWLSTGMVTREWVAVHRKHHAKCETAEDPHSPQFAGIRKVLLEGSELYRKTAADGETLEKFGHHTPDDWLERHIYTPHSAAGIVLMMLIDVLLFGPLGLTIWAVQMIWIPFWAAGVINGLAHWWGYRNYATPDTSTNLVPFGILIGGEELHNNHHAHGSSAKFSSRWWEVDIGWLYIRLLQGLGLAQVKKVSRRPIFRDDKGSLDTDSLLAIVSNRFQVMSHYARSVLMNIYREERRKAEPQASRSRFARARALLLREEPFLDDAARGRLQALLDGCQRLRVAYDFRRQLQDIWQQTTATPEQLLKALQEWCQRAEASGIRALQEFARGLHRYSLQPA